MKIVRKLKTISALMLMIAFNPFGSNLFASECWDQFTQEVANCDSMFPDDNPITALIEAVCILADLISYVFCEIGTILMEA